jgi:Glycosyltransferase family 87
MNLLQYVVRLKGWQWSLLFLAGFAILTGLTAFRVYKNYQEVVGEFTWESRGHADFHNGLYLPARAFVNRDNPYARQTAIDYKMARAAPAYSPAVFILNAPITGLDLPAADVVFFIFNLLLLVSLPLMAIRFCGGRFSWPFFLLLACMALVSRPGHITLFSGYFTIQPVIGIAIALHFAKTRPWLAGLGVLLASEKPNFVLPLLLLMICQRDFRAVAWGVVLSGLFALGGLLWLASDSSIGEVMEGYREGQQALYDDVTELPENRWTRVDVIGMGSRLLRQAPGAGFYLTMMPLLLILPGWALFRKKASDNVFGATGTCGMIVALSVLLSIHHHSYDCLLLVIPWIGLTFFGDTVAAGLSQRARWSVVLLTSIPAANYFSTISFQEKFGLAKDGFAWQFITQVNGACMLIALAILVSSCWITRKESGPQRITT